MMNRRRLLASLAVLLAVGSATATTATAAADSRSASPTASAVLTGRCLNPTVRLSVEEQRLTSRLAVNNDPTRLQSTAFAQRMIDGGGFGGVGPALAHRLCNVRTLGAAEKLARRSGTALWRAGVDRAQHPNRAHGSLPYSDDRPLYWTRLQSEAALRQWLPSFVLSDRQRTKLITSFDKAARGMYDIDFPAGKHVKRLILSGFDPYTLDGGTTGSAAGAVGNNIRHGNPSGALALAVDGTTHRSKDGELVYIEAYTLPVDFPQFKQGYLEDTVGPFMRPGPRQVNASVTVSQAGPYEFDLEQWNGRYHGTSLGNDNFAPCPLHGNTPELAVDNPQCNTSVPRWGGPTGFDLFDPPQWTTTSLPVAQMVKAGTGRNVVRPPGDGWPNKSQAFGVVWHTNYTEFPRCTSATQVTRNTPVPTTFPPPTQPIAPDAHSCSYQGGGGNYLSNESAYRNTLLRDRMGLTIPAGHIHTPDMQHFGPKDLYRPSDATFDAWRLAIVKQAKELVHVVAYTAPRRTH